MKTPFFLAGAPKSGTSSLAMLLGVHPEIFIPAKKELFFFDFNYHRGIEWYSHFFKQSDSRFLGDATPWYMSWDSVPERIAKHFPDARIVFILREPSARAWSHYWHDFSSMKLQLDLSPREYFLRSSDPRRIRSCSFYCRHLTRWMNYFPSNQILLASTNQLRDQPLVLLNAIASFLGCSQSFSGGTLSSERRMTGFSPRPKPVALLGGLQRLLAKDQFSLLADALNRHPKIKKLFFKSRPMSISDETRDWLSPVFEEDSRRLVELVGKDVISSGQPIVLG